MRKLVVYVPAELAKALKVRAAEDETSMSAFITDLLARELKKGGEKRK